MGGGVVGIFRESGPPRGNFVVYVTYKTLSLTAKVNSLKAEILHLGVYNNNNNNNNNKHFVAIISL
jgi:hypothetical protein